MLPKGMLVFLRICLKKCRRGRKNGGSACPDRKETAERAGGKKVIRVWTCFAACCAAYVPLCVRSSMKARIPITESGF